MHTETNYFTICQVHNNGNILQQFPLHSISLQLIDIPQIYQLWIHVPATFIFESCIPGYHTQFCLISSKRSYEKIKLFIKSSKILISGFNFCTIKRAKKKEKEKKRTAQTAKKFDLKFIKKVYNPSEIIRGSRTRQKVH